MFSVLFAALAALPIRVRQWLGYWGGFIVGCVPTRDRRIAELQLALYLRVPHPRGVARRVYGEAGRTALTALNLAPLVQTTHCSDEDLLQKIRASARPVLALTAHLGPWDLLGAYVVSRGLSVATIGRPARSPRLHTELTAIRARYGITTFWRDEPRAVRQIIEHFKAGGLLAALIDQDTRVNGTFSDFFGSPAFTPSSLLDIAARHEALIVTAFIVRTSAGHHEVIVQPIDEGTSREEILRIYHTRLEALIVQYPTQWVWFHKRWRTLPSGERLSSADYERFLTGKIGARQREEKKALSSTTQDLGI